MMKTIGALNPKLDGEYTMEQALADEYKPPRSQNDGARWRIGWRAKLGFDF